MKFTLKEITRHLHELYKIPSPVTIFSFIKYFISIGIVPDYSYINKRNASDPKLIAFLYNAGLLNFKQLDNFFVSSYIRNGCSKILADNPLLLMKKCAKPCLIRRKYMTGHMLDVFRNSLFYMTTFVYIILEYTGYDINDSKKSYDALYVNYDYRHVLKLKNIRHLHSNEEFSQTSDPPNLPRVFGRNIPRYFDFDVDDTDIDDDNAESNDLIIPNLEEHEMYTYHRASEYDIV
jgi:hypothetical protein